MWRGSVAATTTFPTHPKVTRLSRKARNSEGDTYPHQPRPSPPADLKAVNAGNPGAGRGFSPERPRTCKGAPHRASRCGASLRPAECSGEKPPTRPRIPYVYGLEVGSRRRTWLTGIRVPFAVSRFARKTRHLGMGGKLNRGVAPSRVHFQSVSPAEITLGVLAPIFPRATLFLAVSGRGGIPHWR